MRIVADDAKLPRWVWHAVAWPLGWLALAAALTRVNGIEHLGGDYAQFWSASSILTSGGNPYDPLQQRRQAAALGWDIQEHGLGRYAYLPYYYPPWLGLALVPLLPWGYAAAKTAWLALLVVAVAASGFLLRSSVPALRPAAVIAVVCGFGVWWVALLFGQTSPLVVLLLAAAWRLAESGRDRSAGWALAWLSIKPQLALPAVVCVLVWAARQRRWRMWEGFFACGTLLVAVSTCVTPGWLTAMLAAPRETPLVTVDAPWLGAGWHPLLRTAGLQGGPLAMMYLALALPTTWLLARQAWNRQTPLFSLMASSVLGTFALVPYARYYDLPVLVFPLLELLGRPISPRLRTWLPVACAAAPLGIWLAWPIDPPVLVAQGQWLWLVAALGGARLLAGRQARRTAAPSACLAPQWPLHGKPAKP